MIPRHLTSKSSIGDLEEAPVIQTVESFTIITTQASEIMAPLHDRIPLIVDPKHYRWWLLRDRILATNVLQKASMNAMIMEFFAGVMIFAAGNMVYFEIRRLIQDLRDGSDKPESARPLGFNDVRRDKRVNG